MKRVAIQRADPRMRSQVDRDELVAFLVEKSQKLRADKDFVRAMDRLIQFATHMRQRERLAMVNTGLGF